MTKPMNVKFILLNNVEYCDYCKKEAKVIEVIEETIKNRLCYEHFESFAKELDDKGINNNSKSIQDYFNKQNEQRSRRGENRCLPLSKY